MKNPHSFPEGPAFKNIDELKNKHALVMGLGLNGGGEESVRFLLSHGAKVTVTDMKTKDELHETISSIEKDASLPKENIRYHLGGHSVEDFENADFVIKNPVVKFEGNKFLAKAKKIETDISLFLSFTTSPIIAVTGSKGKSSTVSAIHYGFQSAGIPSFLGGNITISPLSFLAATTEKTPVVLELSSWQLRDLRGRNLLKPKVSLITKIIADHQNWYGDMESYIADKRVIYKNQDKNDFSIFDFDADNAETPKPETYASWGDSFAHESKACVLRYSRKKPPEKIFGAWQECACGQKRVGKIFLPPMHEAKIALEKLLVPGAAMFQNVLNASLALSLFGLDARELKENFSRWEGIPHRLQYFYAWKNLSFYNDSCATVSEAAAEAAGSFTEKIILIAGGTDKGLSQKALADFLTAQNTNVSSLYLLAGSATEKLISDLRSVSYYGPYESLSKLLHDLKENEKNRCEKIKVVFSPGATSFGMFQNEFDRGNTFMNETKNIFQ